MLRTEQITNVKFTPVSKGTYSAGEVDAFLKVVAESYDTLLGEKNELIKKISILADKIESYRNDEEAIKFALLDAHKMAETINKNATIKSDTLIGDAETRAQLIVDGATRQSAKELDEAKAKAKEIVDNARIAVASLKEKAQSEADSTVSTAKEKATQIVADAKANADEIIGLSKKSYEYYTAEIARIQAATADYKASMTAICNDQLGLLESVPSIDFVPSEDINEIAEEVSVVEDIKEETEVETEISFDINEEIAAIEEEINDIDDEDGEDFENEKIVFVPEETVEDIEAESLIDEEEIPEEYSIDAEEDIAPFEQTVEEPENEIDDLFGFIDDVDFDDITSIDSIPSSLDDIVPQIPAIEETVAPEVADDEFDEEEAFEGFKIDLDSIGIDDESSDDDITSLFDSMFDD